MARLDRQHINLGSLVFLGGLAASGPGCSSEGLETNIDENIRETREAVLQNPSITQWGQNVSDCPQEVVLDATNRYATFVYADVNLGDYQVGVQTSSDGGNTYSSRVAIDDSGADIKLNSAPDPWCFAVCPPNSACDGFAFASTGQSGFDNQIVKYNWDHFTHKITGGIYLPPIINTGEVWHINVMPDGRIIFIDSLNGVGPYELFTSPSSAPYQRIHVQGLTTTYNGGVAINGNQMIVGIGNNDNCSSPNGSAGLCEYTIVDPGDAVTPMVVSGAKNINTDLANGVPPIDTAGQEGVPSNTNENPPRLVYINANYIVAEAAWDITNPPDAGSDGSSSSSSAATTGVASSSSAGGGSPDAATGSGGATPDAGQGGAGGALNAVSSAAAGGADSGADAQGGASGAGGSLDAGQGGSGGAGGATSSAETTTGSGSSGGTDGGPDAENPDANDSGDSGLDCPKVQVNGAATIENCTPDNSFVIDVAGASTVSVGGETFTFNDDAQGKITYNGPGNYITFANTLSSYQVEETSQVKDKLIFVQNGDVLGFEGTKIGVSVPDDSVLNPNLGQGIVNVVAVKIDEGQVHFYDGDCNYQQTGNIDPSCKSKDISTPILGVAPAGTIIFVEVGTGKASTNRDDFHIIRLPSAPSQQETGGGCDFSPPRFAPQQKRTGCYRLDDLQNRTPAGLQVIFGALTAAALHRRRKNFIGSVLPKNRVNYKKAIN